MAGVKNAIIAGLATIAICYSAGMMNSTVLIGFLKFWAFIVVLNVVSCICIEIVAWKVRNQAKVKDLYIDQGLFRSIITKAVIDVQDEQPQKINVELNDLDRILTEEIEDAARIHAAKRKSNI